MNPMSAAWHFSAVQEAKQAKDAKLAPRDGACLTLTLPAAFPFSLYAKRAVPPFRHGDCFSTLHRNQLPATVELQHNKHVSATGYSSKKTKGIHPIDWSGIQPRYTPTTPDDQLVNWRRESTYMYVVASGARESRNVDDFDNPAAVSFSDFCIRTVHDEPFQRGPQQDPNFASNHPDPADGMKQPEDALPDRRNSAANTHRYVTRVSQRDTSTPKPTGSAPIHIPGFPSCSFDTK